MAFGRKPLNKGGPLVGSQRGAGQVNVLEYKHATPYQQPLLGNRAFEGLTRTLRMLCNNYCFRVQYKRPLIAKVKIRQWETEALKRLPFSSLTISTPYGYSSYHSPKTQVISVPQQLGQTSLR
jgi:hypothetical protein